MGDMVDRFERRKNIRSKVKKQHLQSLPDDKLVDQLCSSSVDEKTFHSIQSLAQEHCSSPTLHRILICRNCSQENRVPVDNLSQSLQRCSNCGFIFGNTDIMDISEYQWCSWCFNKTTHKIHKLNSITRNEYECCRCGNFTIQCRYCSNMATHRPAEVQDDADFIKALRINWASELCAEHDGTIADFEKLNQRLDDLSEYKVIFGKAKCNLAKGGKIVAGMVAGAVVFCPVAYWAAPGIASALGATGLLGAASTGTVISTLSGAALTSASLAALGPGGMAAGMAFVSAVGAALGGIQGAVVSNNYFGAIKDFKITKVKDGSGPALVFINGFLSQKNQDSSDWVKAVSEKYPRNPYYYVNWESSSLYQMGSLIGKGVAGTAFRKFITELMKRGSKSFAQKLNPLRLTQTVAEWIGNPWHTSMVKASMTGILLADLIARTNNPDGFILMGHSLGSRVIYYLLCALATKPLTQINDVFLLGGAVDRKDAEGWNDAIKAVKGKIVNCYSNNDSTLKFLYQGANALSSSPIGLGDIEVSHEKLVNKDVSSIIGGHMQYKDKFAEILKIMAHPADEYLGVAE
jgi:hypothetical protein